MDTINENQTTEVRVMNAIERINERGEKVTNNSVKHELGGGSFSTISPFLKKWRESQRQTTTVISIPDKIRDMIFHHGGLLYQQLKADSMEDYESLKTQYKADKEDLEAENTEQAMELTRLEEKLAEALKIHAKQDERVASLLEDLQQATAQHAMEQTKRQSSDRLASEYKDNWNDAREQQERYLNDSIQHQATIADQQQTITGLNKDNEHLTANLASVTGDGNQLTDQVTTLTTELTTLQKTIDKAQSEQQQSEQAAKHLQKVCADQEETINTLNAGLKELDTLRQSLTKCQTELDSSKSRARELIIETGELKRDNKELLKLNGKLEAQAEKPVVTRK